MRASALGLFGEFRQEHFRSIYFHTWTDETERRYDTYLRALARSVREIVKETDAFVACVGMEALDRDACERLSQLLNGRAPCFVSDEHDMFRLVSILRHADVLLSSRFHAIVSTLPAGVPAVGVTMDERIANLLNDTGHAELLLRVDDPDLAARLIDTLRDAFARREELRRDNKRFIPSQLRLLAQMGMDFEDELARVYPDFPRREGASHRRDYLPLPLSPNLQKLPGATHMTFVSASSCKPPPPATLSHCSSRCTASNSCRSRGVRSQPRSRTRVATWKPLPGLSPGRARGACSVRTDRSGR